MSKDKTKKSSPVRDFFGGLLGQAAKASDKNTNDTAKGVCKSRGLGYDPSTGKCVK